MNKTPDEIDVEIYREIYYEHVKPNLRKGVNYTEMDKVLIPVLKKYNWTLEKFHFLYDLDFWQRVEYNNKSNTLGEFGLPELRCLIRSDEKRN